MLELKKNRLNTARSVGKFCSTGQSNGSRARSLKTRQSGGSNAQLFPSRVPQNANK